MAFRPIEPLRAHEEVAEQIRRQISLRLVAPGAALPPERQLAATFGVGKATVEAAIRLLEADGLVTTRRGRYGGRFVTGEAGGGNGRDALLTRVRADAARIEQALAFRAAVDGLAARLAAGARGTDGLAAIAAAAAAVAAAPDDAAFMAADTAFHLELARTGGNAFVLRAVEDVRLALNDAFAALPESRRWHERSLAEHAALVAAVEAGDADAAEAAARMHAASTERGVRALLRAVR